MQNKKKKREREDDELRSTLFRSDVTPPGVKSNEFYHPPIPREGREKENIPLREKKEQNKERVRGIVSWKDPSSNLTKTLRDTFCSPVP